MLLQVVFHYEHQDWCKVYLEKNIIDVNVDINNAICYENDNGYIPTHDRA